MQKPSSLKSLLRTSVNLQKENSKYHKNNIRSAANGQNVTVPQSSVIFCDICDAVLTRRVCCCRA